MKTSIAFLVGMILVVGFSVALVDSQQTSDGEVRVCPYSGANLDEGNMSRSESSGERCPFSGGGDSEARSERDRTAGSDMSNSV